MSTINYPKVSVQNTPQFKQTNYNISSIESLIKNSKLQYGTCASPIGNLSFVSDNSNYSISYRMTQIKKGVITNWWKSQICWWYWPEYSSLCYYRYNFNKGI